ncbi:hypothetical protein SSX86_016943 [Deinandra increscens subsp. villosa]|uniref:Uncharacterized protein n=1 Tax=Deinandra increscens subsp. villosa TaxID=3103831 RepID=A0AAP0GTT7_9ASTR
MEDPEESDWKIYQEYSCSKEDDHVVKWMLRKGYVIGKKMVITGIVVSSAPLVLPPLAVFSAMGVAFSVPFGLLYASYACTNKIMNILLPLSPPPSPMRMEYYYYYTDKEQMEDIYQGVDNIVLELDDDYRQQLGPSLMINVDKDLDEMEMEMEMDNDMVERENVTEEGEREQMEDVTQRVVEMSPSIEFAGDDLLEEEMKNTVEDGYVAEIIKPVTVEEIESQEVVQVGSKNDEEPIRDVVVLYDENKNDSSSREAEAEELDQNKDERRIESDGFKDGSEDVILIPTMEQHWVRANADPRDLVLLDETRNTNINCKVGDEVEEKAHSSIKLAPLDKNNAKDTFETYKKLSSKETKLDDEKMWEKIGAMRAIVGYKAPSQPTCLGELKALYVFTGVEPPASFEGDSNLDEVDVKLKFLMAIVGVK